MIDRMIDRERERQREREKAAKNIMNPIPRIYEK